MQILINLIKENQSFLVERIIHYAKLHDYMKYTTALQENWIIPISFLSKAMTEALVSNQQLPEITVNLDLTNSPMASFGIKEAQLQHNGGVSFEIYLGLMKYYRQSYIDLITESMKEPVLMQQCTLWINRFFDYNEIAFCSAWTAQSKKMILTELRTKTQSLTNERNKYLTIFECMPTPAILLNSNNRCINMNHAAQQLFQEDLHACGYIDSSDSAKEPKVTEALPWIINEFIDFSRSAAIESTIEKDFDTPSHGKHNLLIKFHRMLDVNNQIEGTVILFIDQTERKAMEEQLKHLGFHDILTGLYNRAYLDQEILRMMTGRYNPVGFIALEVDGLKMVNSQLGISAGDVLLATIGKLIKSCFRVSDVVSRYGGDKFAVLMPASDALIVQNACERVREKISEHNALFQNMPVSLSIGWSVRSLLINESFDKVIQNANLMLDEEKQNNRAKYGNLFKQRHDKYGDKMFK